MDIVQRLRFDAARCEATFSKGVASNIEEAATEIERLRTENANLRRWKALDKPLTAAMAIANGTTARLRAALLAAKRAHYKSEDDCWYSCPKSGECCDDSQPKDFCNCGADEHNARIDAALGGVEQSPRTEG